MQHKNWKAYSCTLPDQAVEFLKHMVTRHGRPVYPRAELFQKTEGMTAVASLVNIPAFRKSRDYGLYAGLCVQYAMNTQVYLYVPTREGLAKGKLPFMQVFSLVGLTRKEVEFYALPVSTQYLTMMWQGKDLLDTAELLQVKAQAVA